MHTHCHGCAPRPRRALSGSVAMALYYFSIGLLPLADAVTLFFLNPGRSHCSYRSYVGLYFRAAQLTLTNGAPLFHSSQHLMVCSKLFQHCSHTYTHTHQPASIIAGVYKTATIALPCCAPSLAAALINCLLTMPVCFTKHKP